MTHLYSVIWFAVSKSRTKNVMRRFLIHHLDNKSRIHGYECMPGSSKCCKLAILGNLKSTHKLKTLPFSSNGYFDILIKIRICNVVC